jgi:hypothetical protein
MIDLIIGITILSVIIFFSYETYKAINSVQKVAI